MRTVQGAHGVRSFFFLKRLFWLHLIQLSGKGSAFCSAGLNDIYWIKSWVRGQDDGGEGIRTAVRVHSRSLYFQMSR